jgi:hypothetical protein
MLVAEVFILSAWVGIVLITALWHIFRKDDNEGNMKETASFLASLFFMARY